MVERHLHVDHVIIWRWVQKYAPKVHRLCGPKLRMTNRSWRVDETYLRVGGNGTERRKAGGNNMKVFFSFLVLSLQILTNSGHPKAWTDWVSEGNASTEAGDYQAAAQAFRGALALAVSSGLSDAQVAEISSSLASAYGNAGQYANAEREWRRALAIVARLQGSDSLNYAMLLASLALLPTQIGNGEAEIGVLRKVLLLNEQSSLTNELAVVRQNLAQLLVNHERYGEAEAVLSDLCSNLGALKLASPELQILKSEFLNSLGMVRYSQRRFADAIALESEAIRWLEGVVGESDGALLAPLNNLATSFAKTMRYEDADAAYRRAQEICNNSFGPDHPTCGVLLMNHSFVLRRLGRKRDAKEAARRSREIRTASDRRNGTEAVVRADSLHGGAITRSREMGNRDRHDPAYYSPTSCMNLFKLAIEKEGPKQ
jgi:tetratricopeptide (TPR) repeat protein